MKRILIIPDFHNKPRDPVSLKGYRNALKAIYDDLMVVIDEYEITTVIGLGDLFDGGYGEESILFYNDAKRFELMSQKVNGEFYEIVGNHIRNKQSTNPECCLIYPSNKYDINIIDAIKEPTIKTPDYLCIEDVNFYFMHYNKAETTNGFDFMLYHPPIKDNGKKNIGLFHTNCLAPTRYCDFSTMSDTNIQKILSGLDVAFTGHIHQPIEPFAIGSTQVINPGSLCITKVDDTHKTIDLPIIDINEGEFSIRYIMNFDLHTDMLTYKENTKIEVKTLRSKKDVAEPEMDINVRLLNTKDWLNKKSELPELDKSLCEIIATDPENLTAILDTYNQFKVTKDFSM